MANGSESGASSAFGKRCATKSSNPGVSRRQGWRRIAKCRRRLRLLNAVNHAFAHLGLTHTQMPHDHWRVWKTARASDLPRVEPRSPKPSIANTASNASEWPGSAYEVSNHCRSRAEPEVRIHFPPADSPSLARFLFPVSKNRQLPRRARARRGGTAGRDAQGSSTSRQLPVISLSGPIPVPQCRLGGSRPWLPLVRQAKSG